MGGGGLGWAWSPQHGREEPWDEGELMTDAMMGSMLYALLGRGIRSALPSDVSHPGALARRSMPANGANYATVGRCKWKTIDPIPRPPRARTGTAPGCKRTLEPK